MKENEKFNRPPNKSIDKDYQTWLNNISEEEKYQSSIPKIALSMCSCYSAVGLYPK